MAVAWLLPRGDHVIITRMENDWNDRSGLKLSAPARPTARSDPSGQAGATAPWSNRAADLSAEEALEEATGFLGPFVF